MGLSTWKIYTGINKGMNSNWFSFAGIIPSVNLFIWGKESDLFVFGAFFSFFFFFFCSSINFSLYSVFYKSPSKMWDTGCQPSPPWLKDNRTLRKYKVWGSQFLLTKLHCMEPSKNAFKEYFYIETLNVLMLKQNDSALSDQFGLIAGTRSDAWDTCDMKMYENKQLPVARSGVPPQDLVPELAARVLLAGLS